VLGEVFGASIQDLTYGAMAKEGDRPGFRVFDIFVSAPHGTHEPHQARYLNDDELESACKGLGLARVPVLYRGPFSKKVAEEYTNGKETVSGKKLHIREGIVIRPVIERRANNLGRVQLKSVSADYLLRKNGTEYH